MVLYVLAARRCSAHQLSKSEIFKGERQLPLDLEKKNPTREKLDFETKEASLFAVGRVYTFTFGVWTMVIKIIGRANINL